MAAPNIAYKMPNNAPSFLPKMLTNLFNGENDKPSAAAAVAAPSASAQRSNAAKLNPKAASFVPNVGYVPNSRFALNPKASNYVPGVGGARRRKASRKHSNRRKASRNMSRKHRK